MNRLTKAEEQVMQILWKLKQAFVKDIIAEYPEPSPPYNTISSMVRVLEKKKFVNYEAFGKTHRYYPLISKSEYRRESFKRLFSDYFDGSHKTLLQHFAREEGLDKKTIQQMLDNLNDK